MRIIPSLEELYQAFITHGINVSPLLESFHIDLLICLQTADVMKDYTEFSEMYIGKLTWPEALRVVRISA